MPPEPPHSQSEDSTNEDPGAQQAELDGYQPLPAHATDDLNALSDSSESSSDESDVDASSPEQHHKICMTIHWPEDESDQQSPREESPPTTVCGGSQSLSGAEADRPPSQCQEPTAGSRRSGSTGRQPADQKEPSANKKDPYVGRKDFSVDSSSDRKDSSANRKDSSANRKDPSADRKDSSADRKDPSADRKDPSADRKVSSADRKDPSADRLSEEQTEAVRRAMQAVRLPEDAVPDWARDLSEQQCQQRLDQLVARITRHT